VLVRTVLKQPQGGPYAEELAEYCHGVSQLHMAERGLDVNTTGLEEKFKAAASTQSRCTGLL